MADNKDNAFNQENFKKYEEHQRKMKQDASVMLNTWKSITSEVFGVSGAAFFGDVERSAETMKTLAKESNKLRGSLEGAQIALGKSVTEELQTGLKAVSTLAAKVIDDAGALGKKFGDVDLAKLSDHIGDIKDKGLKKTLEGFDTLEEKYKVLQDIAEQNGKSIAEYSEETRGTLLDSLGISGDILTKHEEINRIQGEYNKANKEANTTSKKGVKIQAGLKEMAENLRNSAIKAMFEWDRVANNIQRSSGIMLSEMNSVDNMNFTSEMAVFGMSLGEAGQMVGEIGEELQTTNMSTKDMALSWRAVSKATGIASKEVAEIGIGLVKMGYSTEEVNGYFESANLEAKMLGVNSRKVLQSISRNLGKMKAFGFVGGEESLAKMAARAEQLRINIDDIFNVAEKARTIEGAMEMAADLQLVGGSFAKQNPMDLLSAARGAPGEMLEILSTMGSDIGRVGKDGKFTINPLDGDRLRMAAKAVGEDYEKLFNMIERKALDTAKLEMFNGGLDFSQIAEGLDMDPDALRSSFADLMESDGNGGFKLNADGVKFLEKNDIKSLADINTANLSEAMAQKKIDQDNIDTQAASNMAFTDSMNAFITSMTSSLAVFQPMLEWAAGFITDLNQSFGGAGKIITLGLMLALPLLLGKSIGMLVGAVVAKMGGGLAALAGSTATASASGMTIQMPGILKLAGALFLVGAAVVGFSAAMAQWGGDASMGQMVTAAASLGILIAGVLALSLIGDKISMSGVIEGAAAMFIIGLAIVPFAYALNMMGEVSWGAVAASIVFMGAAVIGIIALGTLAAGAWPLLLAGAAALIAVGGMLLLASYSLLVAGEAFEKLANVNWEGFSGMGGALMSAAPGMVAFGLASLAFANPLSILGMLAMTGNLAMLNMVMTPLANSLEKAADSMESFVESMSKMKDVIKDIDTKKLEEMQKLADSMSKSSGGSALNNIAAALSSFISGGSKGSDGGVREIKIKLIGENGREIKHKILKDTATQSGR